MSKLRFASEEYVNKVMPAAPNWGAAAGEPGYIENRTHWEERNEREVFRIDDLRELNKVYNSVILPTFQLTVGHKYIIELNGTFNIDEEEKTGVFTLEGVCETSPYYDNTLEVTFASDLVLNYIFAEDSTNLFIFFDSNSKPSVVITEVTETIQKLPMKFLPDGYPYVGLSPIVEEQTIEGFADMGGTIYGVQNPFSLELIIGQKYIVHWDGSPYHLDANVIEEAGIIYLGNLNYMDMMPGGDIPFVIAYMDGQVIIATESTADSHTICIEGEVVHPLDEKFIPETIARKEYVDAQIEAIPTPNMSAYETKEDAQAKYDELKNIKSDWSQNDANALDYIKNRTHWAEYSKVLVLAETTEKSFTEDYEWAWGDEPPVTSVPYIIPAKNYVVTLNNISYSVTGWSYTNDVGETTNWLGDSRKLQEAWGEDPLAIAIKDVNPMEVPFLIYQEEYTVSDAQFPGDASQYRNNFQIYTNDNADLVKIEKLTDELEYHTLDKNYLPMDDIYESIMSRMAIAEEASF